MQSKTRFEKPRQLGRGLSQMVQMAKQRAKRKVPVKEVVIGIKGDVLTEEWV